MKAIPARAGLIGSLDSSDSIAGRFKIYDATEALIRSARSSVQMHLYDLSHPDLIAALKEEAADPDLAAGLAFARRRRLGPFRPAAERPARRLKDLAALARQGFDVELARRVIDAQDLEELEAEAGADQ